MKRACQKVYLKTLSVFVQPSPGRSVDATGVGVACGPEGLTPELYMLCADWRSAIVMLFAVVFKSSADSAR